MVHLHGFASTGVDSRNRYANESSLFYLSLTEIKAGDLHALEHIGHLNQVACDAAAQPEEERLVIEASTLSTTLARTLTIFENWSGKPSSAHQAHRHVHDNV